MLYPMILAVLAGYFLGNLNGAVTMSIFSGREDIRKKAAVTPASPTSSGTTAAGTPFWFWSLMQERQSWARFWEKPSLLLMVLLWRAL